MIKRILLALAIISAPALAAERQFINPDLNGNLALRINRGGSVADALVVTGSTGSFALGTPTGAVESYVNGVLGIRDTAATVTQATLRLVGQEAEATDVSPFIQSSGGGVTTPYSLPIANEAGHLIIGPRASAARSIYFVNGSPTRVMSGRIDHNSAWTIGTNGGTQTHVINGSILKLQNSVTDATLKESRIGIAHYTNSEEPGAGLYLLSDATTNRVFIGGGTGSFNAATSILFYTAANATTTTGTDRGSISSAGAWVIGSSGGTQAHQVNGNTLEVQAGTGGDALLRLDGVLNEDALIQLQENGTTEWTLVHDSSDASKFQILSNTATEVMSITQGGAVTIGAVAGTQTHPVNGNVTFTGWMGSTTPVITTVNSATPTANQFTPGTSTLWMAYCNIFSGTGVGTASAYMINVSNSGTIGVTAVAANTTCAPANNSGSIRWTSSNAGTSSIQLTWVRLI